MLQAVGMESIPWLTGPFRTKGAILLIQLRLGFPFNLALCTVLQTIPMALPTARGRQGPQELSAYPTNDQGERLPGHLFCSGKSSAEIRRGSSPSPPTRG